ncbi:MAG: chloride channel protein, partial [Chitinophagaceae bacterium]|nr:chloride channel protein [Chitinophagaceae bacterium]
MRLKVNRVQFIMVIATLTGFVSGLMAVLLKSIVHVIQDFVENYTFGEFSYLLFPIVGLVITNLIVNRFFGGFIEKGIAMVLKSIAKWSSFIPFKHTYLHVLTSSITVGFGGSLGLEAPIVATGSSIG